MIPDVNGSDTIAKLSEARLCRTGHYVAYVQRGAGMSAALTSHLRRDAAVCYAPAEGPVEHSHETTLPPREQANGLDSAAASAAFDTVTSRQAAANDAEQSAVSAAHSAAAGANGSLSSREPPEPEALSWFLCTDETVKPVSWDAVAKCKAYILLYMLTQ